MAIGPRSGAWKVSTRVLFVFVTSRAAKTRSSITTIAPRPRDCGSVATRALLVRFAGPSAPAMSDGRIAPVTMTGRSAGSVRSRKYAVSSIVSVPCVTITPASSGARATGRRCGATARATAPARWHRRRCSRAARSPRRRRCRSPAPSRAARSARASGCRSSSRPTEPIVPPVPMTSTVLRGACAAATGAAQTSNAMVKRRKECHVVEATGPSLARRQQPALRRRHLIQRDDDGRTSRIGLVEGYNRCPCGSIVT